MTDTNSDSQIPIIKDVPEIPHKLLFVLVLCKNSSYEEVSKIVVEIKEE